MQGWKLKLLSHAGREILIKANILSKPKCEGGMGFRDFRAFNLALLAKQGWRLTTNPSSFCERVLKSIYFPAGSFLTAVNGARAS
ncbi:hypothetical protein DCAR_0415078 [Daucus carota subsp. sativus]|uniref:Uncharacterized protein n=1 Tax=Daucus carota subsp. sativus TaxID=79200 RepID=A0AAF0WVQ2_DAUCS|nr:hypothetical protein DCAR_0415078 [Daucus carota subsp. sativus]